MFSSQIDEKLILRKYNIKCFQVKLMKSWYQGRCQVEEGICIKEYIWGRNTIYYIVCTSPFFVNNLAKLRNFEVGNYFQLEWKSQPEVILIGLLARRERKVSWIFRKGGSQKWGGQTLLTNYVSKSTMVWLDG